MSFCNVIGISIHTCLHVFENNSEKAIEYFLHVYIVPSKHLGGEGWGLGAGGILEGYASP